MTRLRRALLRTAVLIVLPLLLVELAFRVLIFADVPGTRRISVLLRQPQRYYATTDPNYWTCAALLRGAENQRPVPTHDPLTGWAGFRVEPRTYLHLHESLLDGRRPVLLYGDSFAECVTPWQECWEGLLLRSELGETHALLNFGVGGFGVDQSWLMLRASIEHLAPLDPVVVFSVFIDDDLDRTVLSFRGFPKPRLRVEDGQLVEPEPVPDGLWPYVEEHAPRPLSWAFRYLLHGTDILPASLTEDAAAEEARRDEIRAICRAILTALRDELSARGLSGFVLLFHGEGSIETGPNGASWRERFLLDTLAELGLPYVSSRRAFVRHFGATGTPIEDYIFQSGSSKGHYTALGNEAVFGALLDGLQGRFHGP